MQRLCHCEWNWQDRNWQRVNQHSWDPRQQTRDHGLWRLTLTAYSLEVLLSHPRFMCDSLAVYSSDIFLGSWLADWSKPSIFWSPDVVQGGSAKPSGSNAHPRTWTGMGAHASYLTSTTQRSPIHLASVCQSVFHKDVWIVYIKTVASKFLFLDVIKKIPNSCPYSL